MRKSFVASIALAGLGIWKVIFIQATICDTMAYIRKFGFVAAFTVCASTWAQCDPTWVQRIVAGPPAREGAFMTFDPASGKVILFGGGNFATGTRLNDTWEWDGTSWTQRFPIGALPSARSAGAGAFDSARGRMVIFGGNAVNNSQNYGDAWEWDGTSWISVTAAFNPARRCCAAMAYDTVRNVAVMAGGQDGNNSPYKETWHWNGITWVLASQGGPSGRYGLALAFDSLRANTVFFGGTAGYGNSPAFDDTWEWSGASWEQKTPTIKPAARRFHAMAFDPTRGATLLFGGESPDGSLFSDTWMWSGTAWTRLSIAGPSARRLSAIVYDEARGEIVLFGGRDTTVRGDTWVLSSGAAITRSPSSAIVCPTQDVSFSVQAVGFGTVTYQWRKNGVHVDVSAIPSAATSSLMLHAVQVTDAGVYDCVVSSSCGTTTSDPADLDVYCNCPTFTATNGIADAFALPAETSPITASFTAALNNSNPRPLLKFDQIPEETAGTVGNQNIASSFTGVPADLLSATLTFRVKSGMEIQANAEGTDRMRLGFASGAGTSATFDVRWTRFFGIGNSTDAFFPGVQWGDSIDRTIALDLASLPRASQQGGGTINVLDEITQRGFLDFVVDDDSGVDYMQLTGVRSGNGVKAAWIRSQPSDAARCSTGITTFTVTPAGTGPFTYHWRKNGSPIDTSSNPTAGTATLTLNSGNALDAGSYDCIIGNSCNSVTSRAATLAVCSSDFNCDAAVDDADFVIFVAAYNILDCADPTMPANCPSDLNGDGLVDDTDFSIFVVAYNALLCP